MAFGVMHVGQWLVAVLALSTSIAAQGASNESLLWGPYRPNLYFGVRPRIPQSLMTGLLWSRVDSLQSVQETFRYTCEQNDNMAGYGWDEYDVRKGGKQTIHDVGNMIDIRTDFAKVPGGQHGGSWGVRISGTPRSDEASEVTTSVIFAIGLEGAGTIHLAGDSDPLGYEGSIKLNGNTKELGAFELEVTRGPGSNTYPFIEHPSGPDKPLDRTLLTSINLAPENLWQNKGVVFQVLKSEVDQYIEKYGQENLPPVPQLFTIPNINSESSNVHLVQKVFTGAFEFEVLFSSASASAPMTSDALSRALDSSKTEFDSKFSKAFKPSPAFADKKYQALSKSLLSNLLGGIGYFYGDSVVDKSYNPAYDEENEGFWNEAEEARKSTAPSMDKPRELFTAIPSRPFFPRGFLWDEGFHLLPIADWDIDLTLEILKSWFNQMDEDGWIAREQILGTEARSKVPVEFQVQYPHYANPPTLFLTIEQLLDKMDSNELTPSQKEYFKATLSQLYPLLRRNFMWYRKTQKGDLKSYDRQASSREAYRWKGRTPTHILTSGLDDYPRAQPPHPGELHVDLISWIGLMARSMKRIAHVAGESEEATEFAGYEANIVKNIDELHWDKKNKTFCDATVDAFEEDVHVCHKGYVSIFPFLTSSLAADSPRLPAVLDLISDPEELWSPHGIRSLSKKDPEYGTGENYWRSPVWMNINYLVLTNLLKVAQAKSSPHKQRASDLYMKLRINLVDTVYKSWEQTGFAWEQYDPETGAGKGVQHFTGWTSLITKIICMPDLGGKGGSSVPEHGEL